MSWHGLAGNARLGRLLGLGLSGALAHFPGAAAQHYKCVDAGVAVYSDAPCASAPRSNPDQAGTLSRAQVLSLLAAIDNAAARLDWNATADYYADDAVIEIEIKSSKWPFKTTVGREEYRRLLKDTYQKIRQYSSGRDKVEISVFPDSRRAEVRCVLVERWLDPGGPMMSKSEQVALVELRNGRPLLILTRIVSSEPKPQR